MPKTEIRIYRDSNGEIPLLKWRTDLLRKNKRAYAKCLYLIKLLEQQGFDLRRPIADLLRDGIYELRAKSGREQHRVLYFFAAQQVAVISTGLQKERAIPDSKIDLAISHRNNVKKGLMKYSISLEEWMGYLDG